MCPPRVSKNPDLSPHKRESRLMPTAGGNPGNMDCSVFLDSRFRGNDK